jgi:hypothetical protein
MGRITRVAPLAAPRAQLFSRASVAAGFVSNAAAALDAS